MVGALTVAGFLVFAQAYMVAPILPRLAQAFHSHVGVVGLAVPAYLIPYGVTSLGWGPLADRIGRRPVIIFCLAAFAAITAATAASPGLAWFILLRCAAGAVSGGIIPVGVALIGDTVPYARRGRALGWLFGGMAGGMAIGSSAGALAEPLIGWRGLFVPVAVVAALTVAVMPVLVPLLRRAAVSVASHATARGYLALIRMPRARRAYAYIAFNALLQSGIYTWLGVYLNRRFGLGPAAIGVALLGYGVPGFIFGPAIGRAADRFGRAPMIPIGVAIGALAAFALAAPVPLIAAAVIVTLLSLGYDLTQPLLAGIVTDLPGQRGQSVSLMAVILFSGFGLGSLVFQAVLTVSFSFALIAFGVAALVAAILAVPAFAAERSTRLGV